MTPDESLYRALTSTSGWRERWAAYAKDGLTDAELKDAICSAFGIWGGFHSGGEGFTYSGGTAPQFWIGSERVEVDGVMRRVKPTLSGIALVHAARRVLRIPQPATIAQQSDLFSTEVP